MNLKAGIVGLPNVGKSTIFNAITKKNALAANYPFTTIEPNVGVVFVPDNRLDFLQEAYKTERKIPTSFEFIDIAGLVEGASRGEGLGNKFLSHIREVDAIVHVVRCFSDEDTTHIAGNVNPIRDIEIINTELILADLEIIENRIERIIKKADSTKNREDNIEKDILIRCKDALNKNKAIRELNLTDEEKKIIKHYNFITLKPIIYAANIDEEDILKTDYNEYSKQVINYAKDEGAETVVISAILEEEIALFDGEEKLRIMKDLGLEKSALDNLIFSTYTLLNLATFFTAGVKEARAWTFKKGMKAPDCAEIIHSDMKRGFIRMETISFEDLQKYGSELKVKEAGKLRQEGKDYITKDGDICYFKFNV